MKTNILFLLLIVSGCNSNTSESNEGEKKENYVAVNINGETLFKANCASCHKPNQKYVGPALQGVAARWESRELLYAFVRNSQEIISRNTYAKKLYDEYNQSPMLPYPNLSDSDIDDILKYCDSYKEQ